MSQPTEEIKVFDPNKPFTVLDEGKPVSKHKPKFDPNKPFEVVEEKKNAIPSTSSDGKSPLPESEQIPKIQISDFEINEPDNPIDKARYIKQLEDKATEDVMDNKFVNPANEGAKYAQQVRAKLKEGGFNSDELISEIGDLNDDDFKRISQEQLLKDREENYPFYLREVSRLKWKGGLDRLLNENLKKGNITPDEYDNLNGGIQSALQHSSVGDYSSQRDNINSVAKIIKLYGGDKKDELLRSYAGEVSKIYGNSFNYKFDEAVKNDPNSKYLNNEALLGFHYVQDVDPDKAKQYERLFIDPKTLEDKPDEQRGFNHLMETLEQTGINLQNNAINEELNSLYKLDKENGGLTPEQLQRGEALEKKQQELLTKSEELDNKYPNRLRDKIDDATQEILGQKMNWFNYAGGRTGAAIKNTINGVWEAVSSPFMSDESNSMRELAIMGEKLDEENIYHKTDKNKGVLNDRLVIQPELQKKIDVIVNDESLDRDAKEMKLYRLLQDNKEDFGRVPIHNGKFNVSPSSILYGITDIGTTLVPFIALEAATGGGATAGATRKFLSTFTAAAATSFHDEYAAALLEGKSQSDAYKHALTSTAISSFAMAGAQTPQAIKEMAGLKTSAGKLINRMTDAEIEAAMKTVPKGLKSFAERLKATPKMAVEGVKTGARFEVAMNAANEVKYQVLGTPIDRENNFKQSVLNILNFGILGAGLGHIGYKKPSELQKSAFIETGKNPTEFTERANQMKKDGQITDAEFEQIKSNIESSAAAYKNLPTVNAKGQPLSEKEKGDYLYNEAVKNEALKKSLPLRQKEKAEHTALVADFKNDLILEPRTEKQLESRKASLEKSLEPKKDAEGKAIEVDEKTMKEGKAEIEAIDTVLEDYSAFTADANAKRLAEKKEDTTTTEPTTIPPEYNDFKEGKDIVVDEGVVDKVEKDLENKAAKNPELINELTGIKSDRDYIIVPISEIENHVEYKHEGESNSRPAGYIDELSKSLLDKGIENPATIDVFNGMGYISDGNHRIEAAKRAGLKYIPLEIFNKRDKFNAIGDLKKVDESKLKPIPEEGFKQIPKERYIAEMYDHAKKTGTNPDLVKAVEQSLSIKPEVKNEATKTNEIQQPAETKSTPIEETNIPIGETKEATGEGEGKLTSITHAEMDKLSDEFGFPTYDKDPQTIKQWDKEAAARIEKDPAAIDNLLNKMRNEGIPSPVEQRMMLQYVASLRAKIAKIPTPELLKELNRAKDISNIVGGRFVGQSLVARKGLRSTEDTLGDYLSQWTEAHATETLPQDVINNLSKRYEKQQDLKQKIDDAYEKAEDKVTDEMAQRGFEAERKNVVRKPREKYVEERIKLKQDLKNELEEYKKLINKVGIVSDGGIEGFKITAKMAVIIGKIAKSHINEGAKKLEDVISRVYEEIKDVMPNVSKRDIRDVMAGVYKEKTETRNELAETARNLKSEAILLNKLEQERLGFDNSKSDSDKIKRNSRIQDLQKKINELKKGKREGEKEAADLTKDELAELKKSTLSKIEKINDRIKTKDYSEEEPVKKPIRLDVEARKLQEVYEKMREEDMYQMQKAQYDKLGTKTKWADRAWKFLGLKRVVQTALDFSIPFIQNVTTTLNPRAWIPRMENGELKTPTNVRQFKNMFAFTFVPRLMKQYIRDLKKSGEYHEMVEDGIVFSDPHELKLSQREEDFRNNIFQDLRTKKWYGLQYLGEPIFASERAAAGALNTVRVERYRSARRALEKQGITRQNSPEAYKKMSEWVMNMTGRGKMLGMFEGPKGKAFAGNAFYGARLMASRINLLKNPFFSKMPATLRKEAFKDMVGFTSGVMLTGLALAAAGGKVSFDPDDSDFLQVDFGDKKYDITGGMAAYIRTFLRLTKTAYKQGGAIIDGSKKEKKAANKYASFAGRTGWNFITNKFSPNTAHIYHLLTGKTPGQDEFDPKELLEFYPMYVDDLKNAWEEEGVSSIFTTGLPNIFGVGVQTYNEDKKNKK